jgi:hypothetical protein
MQPRQIAELREELSAVTPEAASQALALALSTAIVVAPGSPSEMPLPSYTTRQDPRPSGERFALNALGKQAGFQDHELWISNESITFNWHIDCSTLVWTDIVLAEREVCDSGYRLTDRTGNWIGFPPQLFEHATRIEELIHEHVPDHLFVPIAPVETVGALEVLARERLALPGAMGMELAELAWAVHPTERICELLPATSDGHEGLLVVTGDRVLWAGGEPTAVKDWPIDQMRKMRTRRRLRRGVEATVADQGFAVHLTAQDARSLQQALDGLNDNSDR